MHNNYAWIFGNATASVVFLFDLDWPTRIDYQNADLDSAFLRVLLNTDPKGTTHSVVGRGDALLSQLTTKITAVSKKERCSSHTQSYDMELYCTLVWDFADALTSQWRTVDLETFPIHFANRPIHCVSLPTLPMQLREAIDAELKRSTAYLGATAFDTGNPVQRTVFLDYLINDAVIADGQVVMELDWDGSRASFFDGAENFCPGGIRWVPYGGLEAQRPPSPAVELSARGKITMQRYEGKRRFTLQERVAASLAHGRFATAEGRSGYAIEVTVDSTNPLEATLPEAKFIRYLLDSSHPKGGSKARFFAESLGIWPKDWRYLAAQLYEGLLNAKLVEVGVKSFQGGFGISFNAVMPVRGLNGRVADLDTNWIMEPGQQPRLSTAVPARKRDATRASG